MKHGFTWPCQHLSLCAWLHACQLDVEEEPTQLSLLLLLQLLLLCHRGNAMLVGVGGSGKQSLARLAAYICGYEVFQISVSSTYGVADFKADLLSLYTKAGAKGIPVMFLMTDNQIVKEQFLVYINDLLATGYIADLFAPVGVGREPVPKCALCMQLAMTLCVSHHLARVCPLEALPLDTADILLTPCSLALWHVYCRRTRTTSATLCAMRSRAPASWTRPRTAGTSSSPR
jgi:hypothetical protein